MIECYNTQEYVLMLSSGCMHFRTTMAASSGDTVVVDFFFSG